MSREVAIVGAGAAGAAAATMLNDLGTVTVFEAEDAVGGRSRTRARDGCQFEIGANYLTATDERVNALIEERIPAAELLELQGDVWTFDGAGTIEEGHGTDSRRLTCHEGLSRIPSALLETVSAELILETRIDALELTEGDWRIRDAEGQDHGIFDAVVLTPPAPLTADILGRSEWSHADCRNVREAIESVPYRPITSVALHYPFDIDRPWYAAVNDDGEHPISWIAREDAKPSHVPDGETVLLVQCSSEFTIESYDADTVDVVDRVSALTADLLDDERLAAPDWSEHHCWRYAVPEPGVSTAELDCAEDHDLYAAGDWVVGEDRLNGALRSGLQTGETVRDALE